MPEQIRTDRRNRKLVRLVRLYVDEDEARIVARHHPRIPLKVEVGDFGEAPTPNIRFVLHGVRQNIDDLLFIVVDKNKLIIVPADREELIVGVLEHTVDELLSFVRELIQD